MDELQHPFNRLPTSVVILALILGGIELVFQIGSYGVIGGPEAIGWRIAAMESYGFFDSVFEAMRAQNLWPFEHVLRFISYSVIHGGITHALMAVVFVLALGKMVGEAFGDFAVFVVFIGSAIIGAAVYGLIRNESTPLIGAYPAAYGLIGAYSYMLWVGLGQVQENQFKAFTLIGFLLGIQLIFGLLFGSDPTWIADLAGFVAGFFVAIFLRPGALGRILIRLRQR